MAANMLFTVIWSLSINVEIFSYAKCVLFFLFFLEKKGKFNFECARNF